MKASNITTFLLILLSFSCLAQERDVNEIYIDAIKYILTNSKVKKKVNEHFSSNWLAKIKNNHKYFKTDTFRLNLFDSIVDISYFHPNCFKDTIEKYSLKHKVQNYNYDTLHLKLKTFLFELNYRVQSPFVLVFSHLYGNYFYAALFRKELNYQINLFDDSRVEILFIIQPGLNEFKTYFSSIDIN